MHALVSHWYTLSMTAIIQKIREEVKNLPTYERETLLTVLDFDMHGPDSDQIPFAPGILDAWLDESERRLAEFEAGKGDAVTLEGLLAGIEKSRINRQLLRLKAN